jgi:hypothetical protein
MMSGRQTRRKEEGKKERRQEERIKEKKGKKLLEILTVTDSHN